MRHAHGPASFSSFYPFPNLRRTGNQLPPQRRPLNVRRVSVQFTVLGSGSAGNCAYLETDHARLLIDAGLSARQIRQRLAGIGRTPENLTGILITHEHGDHTQGLAVLCAKLSIPVFCNRFTQEAILSQLAAPLNWNLFATGARFDIGDIIVDTFSVPHDAQDPVGFLLRTPRGSLGFVTDLGHVTKLVVERVKAANVLVLETNHDVQMLQNDSRRPWSLKQRILSRHGHLSNESAAAAAEQIVTGELKQLYLCHLSRDCNRPEVALEVVGERLRQTGADHVHVEATHQEKPNPTWAFPPLAPNPHLKVNLDFDLDLNPNQPPPPPPPSPNRNPDPAPNLTSAPDLAPDWSATS